MPCDIGGLPRIPLVERHAQRGGMGADRNVGHQCRREQITAFIGMAGILLFVIA